MLELCLLKSLETYNKALQVTRWVGAKLGCFGFVQNFTSSRLVASFTRSPELGRYGVIIFVVLCVALRKVFHNRQVRERWWPRKLCIGSRSSMAS